MLTKRSLEGYLLIDHRNAPGAGAVAAGATFESATVTCSHCHRIVVLNPDRSRERHHCRRCDHYICDQCATGGGCLPMNAVLDAAQERAARDIAAGRMTPGGILLP